jgi:tol-pal system protein YbgF
MSSYCKYVIAGALAAMLATSRAGTAAAQQMQPLPPVQGGAPPANTAPPKAKPAPPAASPSASAPKSGPGTGAKSSSTPGSSDVGLGRRVDQLEEQLVDLQVVIGTLESLAKQGGGGATTSPAFRQGAAPSAGAYSASEVARIDGLETQIRALTAQLEQLADQVRSLSGRRGALPPGAEPPGGTAPQQGGRFGQTTVTTDPIGSLLSESSAQLPPPQRQVSNTLPPAGAIADPGAAKQVYEAAYGSLLQQDYGAAEAGFDDFLKRYPNDPLASNAQYWLGESFFVRGQFKQAAAAFLKGYQAYSRSGKAPDSLLKLAMSLDRLGQRDAACSSYAELTAKFPNAPAHIKNRATSERQRIGCA